MTITELIDHLEAIHEDHGDIPVVLVDYDSEWGDRHVWGAALPDTIYPGEDDTHWHTDELPSLDLGRIDI